MGYIFDALNRGGSHRPEDERPRDGHGDPSGPVQPTDAGEPYDPTDEQTADADAPLAFDVDQFGPAADLGVASPTMATVTTARRRRFPSNRKASASATTPAWTIASSPCRRRRAS